MNQDKKPNMHEVLDSVDPVEMAEQTFGKRWEEWSEDEQKQALVMAMLFNKNKHEIQKRGGDTFMGIHLDEAEKILKELGFVVGYRKNRISPRYNYPETETLWYSADGIVVHLDTFHSSDINRFELFAELKLSDDEDAWMDEYHQISRVPSNGGSYELYPSGMEIPVTEKKVAVNADVRTGLRWKVNLLRNTGTLLSVWDYPEKFIWIVNYDEENRFSHDTPRNLILRQKLAAATDGLRGIMKPFV